MTIKSEQRFVKFVIKLKRKNMLGKTADSIMSVYSRFLLRKLEHYDILASQELTLTGLINKNRNTLFHNNHDLKKVKNIRDYQQAVPLRYYEDFWKEYWEKAFPRLTNITWPGTIPYFGLTSGTTGANTKYIPLSKEMLRSNQKAAMTLQGGYYRHNRNKPIYTGKFFFLGGSADLKEPAPGIFSGDLSGIVVKEAPELLLRFTFPPKDMALISDWEEKLEKMTARAINENITGISGVPSWMLLFFEEAKKKSGKNSVSEIWPNLNLIIHGGIKFDPYRGIFKREFNNQDVQFLETYPASEAFIAFEDLNYNRLRLMLGHEIFYEFIPVEELDKNNPTRHTLHNIETGIQYAIAVTTCAGLWSYIIGDTIEFELVNPPLLRFTGRTKYFLSAFGEHLISEEVEEVVSDAARYCGVEVKDFHVGPVFPSAPDKPGHHRYMIESDNFKRIKPEKFALESDKRLRGKNADYDAHRQSDLSIKLPEIIFLKPGAFREWMKSRGKLGGQNKVPRMDNSSKITEEIFNWMKENKFLLP